MVLPMSLSCKDSGIYSTESDKKEMKVAIVEYRPEWQRLFEREKELLQNALGRDTAIIEHVGSTSVIGLAVKPIIDVMVGLHEFSIANSLVPKIKALSYDYIPQYEDVMPYRRFFIKKVQETATHHIHMFEIGTAVIFGKGIYYFATI